MTMSQEIIKVKELEIQNLVHEATKIRSGLFGSPYWHPDQWCASLFGGHIHCVALGSLGQTGQQISEGELRGRGGQREEISS